MRKLKLIEHISLDGVIQVSDEDVGSFPLVEPAEVDSEELDVEVL